MPAANKPLLALALTKTRVVLGSVVTGFLYAVVQLSSSKMADILEDDLFRVTCDRSSKPSVVAAKLLCAVPSAAAAHVVVSIFSERELTFTFAICYRPSVCRLSVCRLSATLVRRTEAVEIVGNISTAFGTLAIR